MSNVANQGPAGFCVILADGQAMNILQSVELQTCSCSAPSYTYALKIVCSRQLEAKSLRQTVSPIAQLCDSYEKGISTVNIEPKIFSARIIFSNSRGSSAGAGSTTFRNPVLEKTHLNDVEGRSSQREDLPTTMQLQQESSSVDFASGKHYQPPYKLTMLSALTSPSLLAM